MATIRHRYTLMVEYETIDDEVAVLPEDIEADVMYGGLHNYYLVSAKVTRGPEAVTNPASQPIHDLVGGHGMNRLSGKDRT